MGTGKILQMALLNASIVVVLLATLYFRSSLLIPMALALLPIGVYYGCLTVGRQCIAKEQYDSAILRLRGARAVRAGQRLILLGHCFLYVCLGALWIALLDSLFADYK
jgi:hypothetical protein